MIVDIISWALVMAMPGPDIVSIGLQTSRHGQRAGLWTALGATLGVAVWSALSLIGVEALLLAIPALRVVLPITGCAVLAVLGLTALRAEARTAHPRSVEPPPTGGLQWNSTSPYQSLRLGFVTNISNPKALIFFTSFFTQMMSHYEGIGSKLGVLSVLLLVTLLVFSTMSMVLKLAAHTPLAHIPAIRFLPGTIFILISVVYFIDIITSH